jgi:Arc/MetJ-type ribon-helix-helix transcriptional regulator
MPKPGSGLAAELHRRTQAAGLISVRLPAELKAGLESHVAVLRTRGIQASMNSLIRALVTEYLDAVEAGTREPPIKTTTRTEIGV